jgi:hypothetical protein
MSEREPLFKRVLPEHIRNPRAQALFEDAMVHPAPQGEEGWDVFGPTADQIIACSQ